MEVKQDQVKNSLPFIYLILSILVASLKLNDSDDGLRTSASRSRKRTSGFNQYKSKDSTDSVCQLKI